MIFVVRVQEAQREKLSAITHVDGTARVQTVSREQNERYWKLLSAFGEKTGVPILLNTSFNNYAEPIVDSIQDAIACFLTTDLQYLVLGDFLVTKQVMTPNAIRPLLVSPAPFASLEARTLAGRTRHEIVRIFDARRDLGSTSITEETFKLLCQATGSRSIDELLQSLPGAHVEEVLAELWGLWEDRLIELVPAIVERRDSASSSVAL